MRLTLIFSILFLALTANATVVFKSMGPGINVNGGLTADPSGHKGDLYFNSSTNKLRWYNGTSWGLLGGASIGDPVPSGLECSILFVDASGNLAQDNGNFCYDASGPAFYLTGDIFLGAANSLWIGADQVLYHDTTNSNDFIGATKGGSLSGNSNLVVGKSSGGAITSGNGNTVLGEGAGTALTSGANNTIIGNTAGNGVITTNNNSFFGNGTGANATGQGNAGLGAIAVQNGSGDFNTGVGMQACDNLTTGARNTCIGINAGADITSGTDNTLIGRSTSVMAGTYSNSFALGANVAIGGSNIGVLGDSAVNVGIGNVNTSNPTARLHLPAGTTSAGKAPLKITAGSLLTSPESGAIESDGNHLYWSNSTPTRKSLDGGGGGTGINLVPLDSSWISNDQDDVDAENTVGHWLAYADAAGSDPVDMTGGSPNSTCLRTTTAGHVIDGSGSFEFVKGAANRQGEGCSKLIYVPIAYRGTNMMVSLPFYLVSGTFASGDVRIEVYDVTNSTLLALSNNVVNVNGYIQSNFVMPSNTAQVRIGPHVASTSASAYTFSYDDVILGPASNIGSANFVFPWKTDLTFLPSSGFGTVTNAFYSYKRNGDWMIVRGHFQVGTTTATNAFIALPTGYHIDSAKMTSGTNKQQVGLETRLPSGGSVSLVQPGDDHIFFYDGSDTTNIYNARSAASAQFTKVAASGDYASGDISSFEFSVPILEWAAAGTTTGIDKTDWVVDATIAGTNPLMSTSDVTAFTSGTLESSALTLTNATYPGADTTVKIPCSSTNPSTGTTCAAGDESIGAAFTNPWIGNFEVCGEGAIYIDGNNGSTLATLDSFKWVETTDVSQSHVQEGSAIALTGAGGIGTADNRSTWPIRLCQIFRFSDTKLRDLRFRYTAYHNGVTPSSNQFVTDPANFNTGVGANFHVTVKPVDRDYPMQNFIGTVGNSASSVVRTEGANLNCDSGSAITSQLGSWVSSIGNISSGACTVTLVTGIFSAAPYCVLSDVNSGIAAQFQGVVSSSATSLTIKSKEANGSNSTAFDVQMLCTGAH